MLKFTLSAPSAALATRELHGMPVREYLERARRAATPPPLETIEWEVELGEDLVFDADGLALIAGALRGYHGDAQTLMVDLLVDDTCWRDYYGLANKHCLERGRVRLPVRAHRRGRRQSTRSERLEVHLPTSRQTVPMPQGLGGPETVSVPHALLMPIEHPFEILFANQILLFSELRRRVMARPWLMLGAMFSFRSLPFEQRVISRYREIESGADVHPTAVVEGSIIEAGARIGAHCVVRYSRIGRDVRLHDGAKVELSVVGAGTWLMHDLVLYRSVTEGQVFLIHGPYQFSYFERASAAFATILMDYRPDGRKHKVDSPGGLREYDGRFLGSIYRERSKTLGGSMIAPARIIPPDTWLGPTPEDVHVRTEELPRKRIVPPGPARPSSHKERAS